MSYGIRFTASAQESLARLPAPQRTLILKTVKVQLRDRPLWETRNRKPLRPNPLAPWELRIGGMRVFYEVDAVEDGIVNVLAIGVKVGNRLIVAGEEIRI